MFDEIRNIKTGKKDLRSFGYTIGIILLFISAILLYHGNYLHKNLAIIATIFIGMGVVAPVFLKPIYLIWMTFAVVLGWIMTKIILSVVFYIIITPISFITRLFGEDFLSLKKIKNDSHWNNRNSSDEVNQNYEKQF
tara:strand:- start:430 stop:840 length:411 start_codon:yes stop_codon:yes gene_type:complete